MDAWCLTLADLDRRVLAVAENGLGLGVSGKPLGPTTANRFRTVARSCIRRAVDLEIIERDPWPPAVRGAKRRKVRRATRGIDIRSLPDPATVAAALDAMVTHQPASHTYRVMTSVLYYGGLRPSEVVVLRARSLRLPAEGWGAIEVTNWSRSWHRALREVGHPPLRLYDCRHAAATTWLSAGVPLGEAARRLGHSVEVLVSTYVGALTGDEVAANRLIESALDTGTHSAGD